MSMSLYSVFAFLQRIYISRKTYSFTRSPDAEHYTHKNTNMAMISVSACQFLLWCRSLLSDSLYSRKEQLPCIHTRRKHRISILSCTQWPNSGDRDLLTWTEQNTTHNRFLSHLFSPGLRYGWLLNQLNYLNLYLYSVLDGWDLNQKSVVLKPDADRTNLKLVI